MLSDAEKIVEAMFKDDAFSQWLGIEILEVQEGACRLKMTTRPEMLNGFGILHGGITYSLADSAFAFACNSRGRHSVSIETNHAHLKKVNAGETIFAEAKEENLSHKIGLYQIRVTNEKDELIALFKGTNYRSSTTWEI